jgi:hypothetical protein
MSSALSQCRRSETSKGTKGKEQMPETSTSRFRDKGCEIILEICEDRGLCLAELKDHHWKKEWNSRAFDRYPTDARLGNIPKTPSVYINWMLNEPYPRARSGVRKVPRWYSERCGECLLEQIEALDAMRSKRESNGPRQQSLAIEDQDWTAQEGQDVLLQAIQALHVDLLDLKHELEGGEKVDRTFLTLKAKIQEKRSSERALRRLPSK